MDLSVTFYIILFVLIGGFLALTLLKGFIKMLLFVVAVLSAFGTYFWLSKYGYTYLSFLTSSPDEWMVTALSIMGAITIFIVFMHGLFWFSNVFSWGSKMGFGGVKGILTTILMAAVVCWVGVLCVFYYGAMAEMTRARELAQYHINSSTEISAPWVFSLKRSIMENEALSWLESLSPEHDPARLSLAKIIAYLGALPVEQSAVRRVQLDAYMPRSRVTSRVLSLKGLSEDDAIRDLVAKGDMQGLYNNPKLTRFLEDSDVRKVLTNLDIDPILGFNTRATPKIQEEIPDAIPVP